LSKYQYGSDESLTHDLATGGSAKHRLSMALKLVLWFGDAMIDADTMLRSCGRTK
ncbi:hypothetical protein JHM50_005106, partial [Escherichia coli]|nr:hypothetical protein [Escherichia coli]EIW7369473.1 hypothetical protein [Escherichia coli]